MPNYNSAAELSFGLATLLRSTGTRMPDRLEIIKFDPELGYVKLNDYWNGFHKAFDYARHSTDPELFYEEGHTPILGISQPDQASLELNVFIFRPADVSLRGMGRNRVRKLPQSLQESSEILVTRGNSPLLEPTHDPLLMQQVALLES